MWAYLSLKISNIRHECKSLLLFLWVTLRVVYSATVLFGTESTLHISTPGEMKRGLWLSTVKHETLPQTSLPQRCLHVCVCIKSARYQQSTIHQMNKNSRSNPAVNFTAWIMMPWCHRKLQLSYNKVFCWIGIREREQWQRIQAFPGTDNKETHTQGWLTHTWGYLRLFKHDHEWDK